MGFPYASFYLGLVNNGDVGLVTDVADHYPHLVRYASDHDPTRGIDDLRRQLGRLHHCHTRREPVLSGRADQESAYIAVRHYPETAHLELEQLNPGDPAVIDF